MTRAVSAAVSARRAGLATVLAATLAVGAAVAVAAAPSGATPPSIGFAPVRHLTSASADGFNRNGYNWSGYAKRGSGFSSIVANWTEPQVTCNSNNNLMAPWVGIDGYGSKTVEQTGVATWCNKGKAFYRTWYEMYPKAPVYYPMTVAAGDKFTARVTRNNHTYTLSIRNLTRHWSKVVVKTLKTAQNASAEAIIESPTGSYPNFGQVNFTGVTINGKNLATFHPIALDASNKQGYEDHTTAISHGTDFSILFKHA